ncbi:hypothetical protein [Paenilisteria newyorkensis]|uniref:hypothetical protein n=1 Tax=Listeria newyorkensis TaxID=1497681 RepID=UPI002359F844|nr:hypothetical protein [Listeria newyorkensis]WAO22077.1 hypothetical protein OTR81_01940 [Listeria newyorkensis]
MKFEVSKKTMLIIIGLLTLLVLIGGSLFAYNQYQIKVENDKKIAQEKQKKADEKKEAEINKQKEKEFKVKLFELSLNGMGVSTQAETIGDSYSSIWSDAIFEDEGASVGGKKYTDFNEAISAQKAIYEENGDISSLDADLSSLTETFDSLKANLTPANETLFQEAEEYYDKLINYVSIAKNPSGSYQTYSEKYGESKSEYITVMSTFSDSTMSD